MSRSYRHTPKTGVTTARSEAWDKRHWHKKLRAAFRDKLHHDLEDPNVHFREVSDPWGMAKDGKTFWGENFSWAKTYWGKDFSKTLRRK